jgi:hypothetical protein
MSELSKKTFLIILPHPNRGHFQSWLEQTKLVLEGSGFAYYVITPETIIAPEIIRFRGIQTDSIPLSGNSTASHFIARLKLLKIFRVFKKINPRASKALGRLLHVLLNFLISGKKMLQAHPHPPYFDRNSLLTKAFVMAQFVPGEVEVLHFYAEELANEEYFAISLINSIGIQINFFAFDVSAINIDKISYFNSIKSICFSNEYSVSLFESLLPSNTKIHSYVLSDFISLSNYDENLICETSRPVVALLGSISERKNLEFFLDAAFLDESGNFLWKICGEIDRSNISQRSQQLLTSAKESPRKNLRILEGYLTDEMFDKEFMESDYLFIMYKEWEWSSNILSNAVFAQKTCITGKNGYIANIVRDLNCGIILNTESPSNLIDRLKSYTSSVDLEKRAKFLTGHTIQNFRETLRLEICK